MIQSPLWYPPEWHPQSAILLAWPHEKTSWRPWLAQVQSTYLDIINAIIDHQQVILICHTNDSISQIKNELNNRRIDTKNIVFYPAPYDDTWIRDYGPITILSNNTPTLLDFNFNGWGEQYSAEYDNKLNQCLYHQQAFGGHKLDTVSLILEGGSIETDGHGTLLTTRSCLLARNKQLTEETINSALKQLMGLEQILWLSHGHLSGDDTDGHIDTLARFCNANTLCYVQCEDKNDEHYAPLQKMKNELQNLRDTQGQPYHLIPLPIPSPKYNTNGKRLPATYANFLITNQTILVPIYQDPNDQIALTILTGCFPDHEVMGINCLPLIEQYGSLHCITMQLPKEVLAL